jgi:hypothetical protein
MASEQEAIRAYHDKHSTCNISRHPWQAVFGAGYEAGWNAARATDRTAELEALVAEALPLMEDEWGGVEPYPGSGSEWIVKARAALSGSSAVPDGGGRTDGPG